MEGLNIAALKSVKRKVFDKVFDFDGTITIMRVGGRKERLFKLLVIPYLAYTLFFLARPIPNEDLVSVLRQIQRKKKYKFLIASSRPYFFKGFLKRWLLKYGIDCPVICLWRFKGSPTKIKLEFIKDIEADEYVENNETIRERFRKNAINVSSSSSFCKEFRKKIKIESS